MTKKDLDKATKQEIDAEREKFMAITFILGSANNRYKNYAMISKVQPTEEEMSILFLSWRLLIY